MRHARAKALRKARAVLLHVRARPNQRRYKNRDYTVRQLDQRRGSTGDLVQYRLDEVKDDAGNAQFALTWRPQRQALRRMAQFNGRYRLLNTLDKADHSMGHVLALYKGQIHAEGTFKQIKH